MKSKRLRTDDLPATNEGTQEGLLFIGLHFYSDMSAAGIYCSPPVFADLAHSYLGLALPSCQVVCRLFTIFGSPGAFEIIPIRSRSRFCGLSDLPGAFERPRHAV